MTFGIVSVDYRLDHLASAETQIVETVDRSPDLPSYFSAVEYTNDNAVSTASLIDSNYFMFNTTSQNYLELSFKTNGKDILDKKQLPFDDVYQYVYFENENDLSSFKYFEYTNIDISVNGEGLTLPESTYKFYAPSNQEFSNATNQPEVFRIRFNYSGTNSEWSDTYGAGVSNAISLINERNTVIEGLYTITVNYIEFTCTQDNVSQEDLTFNALEPAESFHSSSKSITYSFLVLDESNYRNNSRPIITGNDFLSTISISETVSRAYGYYYYNNYSTADNSISSLSYDASRYDVRITKTLNGQERSATLTYNYELDTYTYAGEDIVAYTYTSTSTSDGKNTNCSIYFYDVGDYSVFFNAVATFKDESQTATDNYTTYKIAPLTNTLRQAMVFIFGYQLTYLDKDLGGTTYTEFKINNIEEGTYSDSADITAKFLESNPNYKQNSNNASVEGGNTFQFTNILQYTKTAPAPVVTNQTPLRFTSNAKLSTVRRSELYTTNSNYGTAYNAETLTVNGEAKQLYYTPYTGGTITQDGTYIVLLAYTFSNYYSASSASATSTIFYQVFYFTINSDTPDLILTTETTKSSVPKYTNENVVVVDKNILNIHNKELVIRVYAQNFDGTYLSSYGGDYGIDLSRLGSYTLDKDNGGSATFTENTHYTIRIFYKSSITDSVYNIKSKVPKELIKREKNFTIDKEKIGDIGARVATASNTTSNYIIGYDITPVATNAAFVTNQSIVVSWGEKDSHANTYAKYRFVPIVEENFYKDERGNDLTEEEVSGVLENYLTFLSSSYLPVNYQLDFSQISPTWNLYPGNTQTIGYTISGNYVLNNLKPGLYIFDFYDDANNHSYQLFLIDTTTPLFATRINGVFEISPSYMYIDQKTELYWGNYKAIAIGGLDTFLDFDNGSIRDENETLIVTPEQISAFEFCKDQFGETNVDIYKTFYYELYSASVNPTPLWQYLTVNRIKLKFLTISTGKSFCAFDSISQEYTIQTSNNGKNMITYDTNIECTYRLLIKDASNTQRDLSNTNPVFQYTAFYSAMQVIIVSHDSSSLRFYYDGNGEDIYLTGDTTVAYEDNKQVLITYVAPINVNKTINYSYVPTPSSEGSFTIQLESLTVDYYDFRKNDPPEEATSKGVQTLYNYMTLSGTPQRNEVYKFEGSHSSVVEVDSLFVDGGVTKDGVYIIRRTYHVDDSGTTIYSFNDDDYVTRIFVIIVDRHDVIEGAKTVINGDSRHAESLVGGEIFVSMYDTGSNSNLVVTFPDAPTGNLSNTSLVGGTFETNKLPVSVLIPAYKYTKYVTIVEENGRYHYELFINDYNIMDANLGGENNIKSYKLNEIDSYLLYAEIYKDYETATQQLLYKTTTSFNNPTNDNIKGAINNNGSKNGYFNFYDSNNNLVTSLTQEGNYTVIIYQAYNSIAEVDGSTFKSSSSFSFTIKKTDPDFDLKASGGKSLNYESNGGVLTYYTNQNVIDVYWDKSKDDYSAEIDQNYVLVSVNGALRPNINSLGQLFSSQITVNSTANLYSAQLNFSNINGEDIYKNGNFIDITMRYTNHNSAYYNEVHKRIMIDTQAPNEDINELVSQVVTNSGGYITEKDLRVYSAVYTNGQENTIDPEVDRNWQEKTCFNTSKLSDTYRYFSFAATKSFVTDHLLHSDANFIYYKGLEASYKYAATGYEVDPYEFSASNGYTLLDSNTTFEVGRYYEFVESDLAGNLTIYTLYFIDDLTDELDNYTIIDYLVNGQTENAETGFVYDYTRDDYISAKANGLLTTIYARPTLDITSINYFKNTWFIFRASTTSTSGIQDTITYYLISPWVEPGTAYRLTDNQPVSLMDIINGNTDSTWKDSLTFLNTYYGATERTTSLYFNTRVDSIKGSTTPSNTEDIVFSQPTLAELNNTASARTFLTKLKIYLPDARIDEVGSESNPFFDVSNPLGVEALWRNSNYTYVNINVSNRQIIFTLNYELAKDTKIVYEYVDNYGNFNHEIHRYDETYIAEPVSSENVMYSFNYNDGDGRKLYYITEDGFRYTYNSQKYYILTYKKANLTPGSAWDNLRASSLEIETISENTTTSIRVNTYHVLNPGNTYSYLLRIDVYDIDDVDTTTGIPYEDVVPVQQIYFILNNNVPKVERTNTNPLDNSFKLTSSGMNVTTNVLGIREDGSQDPSMKVNYYSSINLNYNISSSNLLPVAFYLSRDGGDWEQITNGTDISCPEDQDSITYYLKVWYDIDEITNLGYRNTLNNDYGYIFEFVPTYQIYSFTLSSALSTAYYLTYTDENGATRVVNRSGQTYSIRIGSTATRQYANHYIINCNYDLREDRMDIVTNTEQYITWEETDYYDDDRDKNVRTYIYTISNLDYAETATNISRFSTVIAVTFVPPTNAIVGSFYTTSQATWSLNTNYNLVERTSHSIIIPAGSSRDFVELRWTRYYAISQNTINIKLIKNGVELSPTVFTEGDFLYTYLTRSGVYTISFEDVSGNKEVFCAGTATQTENFSYVFIKDIAFYLTYTNPLTEELTTTEPIKQAVYNGEVTLTLDTNLLNYYLNRAVELAITKDGKEYTLSNSNINVNERSYTFTETGVYTVTFTAKSNEEDDTDLRSETYTFTILDPDEYRSSYIVNKYSSYYIQSIFKNNVDVTSLLTSSLALDKIVVNSQVYLAELTLSYLDERTGSGTYYITVNSNEKLYSSDSLMSSWTFKVIIKVGKLDLITSSVEPGGEVTGTFTISFNAANVYNEFGKGKVRVIYYDDDNAMHLSYEYDIDDTTTEVQNPEAFDAGHTYFVQIVSESGKLLYSFKVTAKTPLNAAAIIIIVIAVLLVIAIIVIVVILRKRITVK